MSSPAATTPKATQIEVSSRLAVPGGPTVSAGGQKLAVGSYVHTSLELGRAAKQGEQVRMSYALPEGMAKAAKVLMIKASAADGVKAEDYDGAFVGGGSGNGSGNTFSLAVGQLLSQDSARAQLDGVERIRFENRSTAGPVTIELFIGFGEPPAAGGGASGGGDSGSGSSGSGGGPSGGGGSRGTGDRGSGSSGSGGGSSGGGGSRGTGG